MKKIIWCDFDGTISVNDTVDYLLDHYGQDGYQQLEQQWLAGEISSKVCMGEQIALLDISYEELIQCLEKMEIDAHFQTFTHLMQQNGFEVRIVSDGLDFAIKTILKRFDLHHLPVIANNLQQIADRRWQLNFPYSFNCKKESGTCKCQVTAESEYIIYIGDSTSDFCVADKADIVFAKGKLINYCQQKNIKHYPINGFIDVISFWKNNQCIWRDND